MVMRPVQLAVSVYLRACISTHGFWKRGTTMMFDIIIVNIDAGSYLRMTAIKGSFKGGEVKEVIVPSGLPGS